MKLSQINIDPDLQFRVNINKETVTEYAEALRNGVKFPSIILFHDGTKYYLADGIHRYFAHKEAGLEIIDADVREGTRRSAMLYAAGANNAHGLPRTHADKRKAVCKILDDFEWSEWSDREIAKACNVSNMLVSAVRKAMGMPEKESVKYIRNGQEIERTIKPRIEEIPDPTEEDHRIQELATTIETLANENEKLEARVAVVAMDATDEERNAAQELINELQAKVKSQEIEIRALKVSRDTFQNKNAELMKQINYWKKQVKQAA